MHCRKTLELLPKLFDEEEQLEINYTMIMQHIFLLIKRGWNEFVNFKTDIPL